MAETWPTDLVPYSTTFSLQANTTVFRSPVTRSAQRLKRQGQLWRCTASFRLPREKHHRLDALLLKGDGAYGSFLIWDFAHPTPQGANLGLADLTGITYFTSGSSPVLTGFASGSPPVLTGFIAGAGEPRVRGGWARGVTSIVSERWAPDTTPLMAGDKFGVGGYLYELTDDADADGSGYATLNFRPPLRAAVANRAAITRTRPRVEMMLVDDDQGAWRVDVDRVYQYTISFIEVL